MGDRTPFPSAAAITRAQTFTREAFLHPGETREDALAPGTPRRRALDAALIELKRGLTVPSLEWRREFSLLLGLERVLSEDEPRLADGTSLNPHQVDALSGTLTALLAQAGTPAAAAAATEFDDPTAGGQTASAGGQTASAGGQTGRAAPLNVGVATRAGHGDPDAEDEDAKPETDGTDPEDGGTDPEDEDEDGIDDESEDDDWPDAAEDDDDEDEDDEDEDDDEDDEDDDDEDDEDDEDEDDDDELAALAAGGPEEPAGEEDLDDPEEEADDYEPEDFSDDHGGLDEDAVVDVEDPGADRRFWFEHATGAGKTVAAMGFVEASRTGGVLILTHRRNLVDQFIDEIKTRGYRDRLCAPLLVGQDAANGPVTVETYQWFVRNAGKISDAYTVVICDEAHTALGEKTSAQIRSWDKPVWIGMTATGALIARHVTDLFPTQTSRFDLAQAARRGVIAPLRCIRIPPGPGVRTIAKVPLRRGEVDTEFDQEMLAELLDQTPFNLAIADLYKTRFADMPGVVYAAGVKHAYNVAESFRALGMKAQAVSGETPKRELARILADYEAGKVDVLVNAQLLAEGWNSPRATICMHLAPTASKRIYQQRVGRVTRRHPGKEAGIVIDFVHPATKHDDPVVTLHSLLDRDVYRGGAIVVGPVRRGRGRRIRVERRVLPVTPDPERRAEVFERELWRIAVEHLDYGEQHVWAALAGARVQVNGWRRARAMLHFDRQGELRRRFLINALQRNRSAQIRIRALQEIAAGRDAEAFDSAIDLMGTWPKDERREGVKIMLLALAERRIGRRDQANAWIWRMAEYTREVHEEYAAQRWPETKRLLGLLVNSSGSAHARNARRLVHATRTQDRRLAAALLAAALAHTPEAEEALRGARTRMARKPAALARELLRNFPKQNKKGSKRRRKARSGANGVAAPVAATATPTGTDVEAGRDSARVHDTPGAGDRAAETSTPTGADAEGVTAVAGTLADGSADAPTRRRSTRRRRTTTSTSEPAPEATPAGGEPVAAPSSASTVQAADAPAAKPKRRRTTATATASPAAASEPPVADSPTPTGDADAPAAKPTRRRTKTATAAEPATATATTPTGDADAPAAKPTRRRTKTATAAEPAATPTRRRPPARRPPAPAANGNGDVGPGLGRPELEQTVLDLDAA
ncbi:DEAD/DEAH box helicase [Conexibacter sp. DBS9H8]|uniref:DEAD/DEAH box helicase n=1 Tax=Conexibacter sp. DBS9H8 TaxID=2937801 RepID=UPI00200F5FAE|nr:DEAD/DEAH box helicase family protein [Conexibacter sp. DBS9H8]